MIAWTEMHPLVSSALALLPVLGYAEIHYRMQLLPSRLYMRWPEILADVPFRLEPHAPLPVLLLVKDAHRFPVILEKVELKIWENGKAILSRELLEGAVAITQPWWEKLIPVDLPEKPETTLQVNVVFHARRGKKQKVFVNDNYPQLSHRPFEVIRSGEPLPLFPGQFAGDLHTHSRYTSDQVEFGASLTAVRAMGKAVGLHFAAITDHSYDLDDHHHNFLRNSRHLEKWRAFQHEVARLNHNQDGFLLIPGEEVSARNAGGRTVHFLVLNSQEFFPGSGDGAERFFHSRSELSVAEILEALPDSTLAAAAHPGVSAPRLERLLLRRGNWSGEDLSRPRLDGLQAVNGTGDGSLAEGLKMWGQLLLSGKRSFLYGGNDAHGNFNRYRQIHLPFWSMAEHTDHIFGKMRTVLSTRARPKSPEDAVSALRRGASYVTTGPALQVRVSSGGKSGSFGSTVGGSDFTIDVRVKSSGEFGAIRTVRLIWGDFAKRKETEIRNFRPKLVFQFAETLRFSPKSPGYLRVEVVSGNEGNRFFAWGNPIWLEPG